MEGLRHTYGGMAAVYRETSGSGPAELQVKTMEWGRGAGACGVSVWVVSTATGAAVL